ncbi:PREDICTED: tripartite motif-containing protein 10 [Myotis brandtii]|uniref:tripartite motif-containing protein 10 n=1 Tax=Myotis brandtii TaxID=109478 RepID=UPI000703DB61|nr:PREDICTED: tripartite motif-containing protein 10 [Myotis brandtii]
MAAATPVTSLEEEVSCPICQGALREPVTIDCGHNFCRGCLTRSDRRSGVSAGGMKDSRMEWRAFLFVFTLCALFGRGLTYSSGPSMLSQREQIQTCLECLRKETEEIQEIQSRENQRIHFLLTQVATRRQRVISEFARLRQFLEEQHGALLAQLEGLEGDILKQRDEFDMLVTGEMSRFSALITELEEKKERSARELLTNIRSTLIRCEARKCRKPEAVSPELGQRIRDLPQQALLLQREMKVFLEKLCCELDYKPELRLGGWLTGPSQRAAASTAVAPTGHHTAGRCSTLAA